MKMSILARENTKMEVRLCESTLEAIWGQILVEENIFDYVRGCWVTASQPDGEIYLSYPHSSPRILAKLPLLVFKMYKNWSK